LNLHRNSEYAGTNIDIEVRPKVETKILPVVAYDTHLLILLSRKRWRYVAIFYSSYLRFFFFRAGDDSLSIGNDGSHTTTVEDEQKPRSTNSNHPSTGRLLSGPFRSVFIGSFGWRKWQKRQSWFSNSVLWLLSLVDRSEGERLGSMGRRCDIRVCYCLLSRLAKRQSKITSLSPQFMEPRKWLFLTSIYLVGQVELMLSLATTVSDLEKPFDAA